MKEENVYLQVVLSEMCSRVGAKIKDINPKEEGWYEGYDWTKEEQEDFSVWMTNFLYFNSQARKELLTINIKNKKLIRKAVDMFILSYGWKVNNYE